ncbi:MAG: hypothetical protein ABI579_03375, partial [Candidatus Sumerlaeota bacterium]
AVSWFTGLCWWHRNVAIDDAWITFRYARNFATGHGLVFNLGEALEGYSNFLWVLFSSAAISANVEPLGAMRALSWLSVAGGFALLIYGIPRARMITFSAPKVVLETEAGPVNEQPLELPPFSSATAALILAASYPLAVWTMMGLETAFYAMLLLALIIQLNELWRAPTIFKSAVAGGLLVALAMTRPEGAMWVALLFTVFILRHRPPLKIAFALPLTIFAAAFVVYTAWRFQTFGTVIPNTVSAKVGGGAETSLLHGLKYFAEVLALGFIAPFFFSGVVVSRLFKNGYSIPQKNLLLVSAYAVALQTAFAIGVGGDWMPSARFFVPALGPLCILTALAIGAWPLFVRTVIIAYFLFAGFLHAKDEALLRWCRWTGKELGDTLITAPEKGIGDFLRVNAKPTDVLAATEAGVVPYYSRLPFIDMLGLVDAHIAALPGGLHQKYDAGYVLSRRPDLILLGFDETPGGLMPKWPPDQGIFTHADFTRDYVQVQRWPRPMNGPTGEMLKGWMVLYKRRGI